jgi:hypothetical protein
MAEESITGRQHQDELLMNSREFLLNGCLRLLDYIVKVRQNLVAS